MYYENAPEPHEPDKPNRWKRPAKIIVLTIAVYFWWPHMLDAVVAAIVYDQLFGR